MDKGATAVLDISVVLALLRPRTLGTSELAIARCQTVSASRQVPDK